MPATATAESAPPVRSLRSRLLRAASVLTTPLLPDDYLAYVDPLFSTREPRARVDAVLRETPDAATLWLRTRDPLPAHRPGQYVRVGVEVDGVLHWRTYSITSPARRDDNRLSITVKAIDDGVVSHHLVHRTTPGTVLRLAPPAGDFVLHEAATRPRLFVTAGSGITPVMSMLRGLDAAGTVGDTVHVHLAPSQGDVIFGDELRRIAHRHDGLVLHEHHDDRDGMFDVMRLDALAPDWPERDAWACGPAGLLDALTARYAEAGVPDRLNLERFRSVVPADGTRADGGEVTFARAGITARSDGLTPLLVSGEAAGALLPNGCRMGICQTCVCALRSGTVVDLRTGEATTGTPEDPVLVKTCISTAAGDVELDI